MCWAVLGPVLRASLGCWSLRPASCPPFFLSTLPSLPPPLPLPLSFLASRSKSKLVVNFSPAVVRWPFQVKYYSRR